MILGALLDSGLELAALEAEIKRLALAGLELRQERVRRGQFIGTRAIVVAPENPPHRHYHDIVELILKARFAARIEEHALAIFQRLGEVEAALHGWPLEKVHFHEVGAADSIADIVGSAAGLELLGIDEVQCSALNVGSGTVETEHGTLPVPAPATAALLRGAPVYSSGIAAELVTPTGAAIVATLAKRFGAMPAMKITGSGYGAGSRDNRELPNLLRVTIGESAVSGCGVEPLAMLEANLDDMNPQLCGHFAERAFAAGALDVFFAAVQMKKNRPGVLISVLCRPEDREKLMNLYFEETTTLGVRSYEVMRRALEREIVPVSTPYGEVRVKIARQDGRVVNFSPEYEDCKRLAEQKGVPLRTVIGEATFAFRSRPSS